MLRIKKIRLVDSKVCKTEHLAIVFLYFVCLFVNSVPVWVCLTAMVWTNNRVPELVFVFNDWLLFCLNH